MYPVSGRFLTAIAQNHRLASTATITLPGGDPQGLTLSAGSVTTDRTQRIRRTADLTILGGSTVFELVSTPGAQVTVTHGVAWSGADRELVPMIVGELASAAITVGDGAIRISVADLWQRIGASDYVEPFTPDPTATRVAVIIAAIYDAYPDATIINAASDTGTVGTSQAWTSRADMITSLATDGGFDAYFGPDGTFTLTDTPTPNGPVVWLIKTGDGGTLTTLTRTRPLGQVYNTVIVEPATADSAQAWDQVVAQISDPTNPLHPQNIGVRPYRYQAPTVLTETDAETVAEQLLFKVQGSTETLSVDAVANPALEAGDIVRLLTPIDGGNTIVSHFLDSVTTDLATGGMSCATRVTEAALTVNQPPTASFVVNRGGDNNSVAVDGSASTDPDGSIASYAWAFGDGATSTGATAAHTYTTSGTFTISLTVTDGQGATGTAFSQVSIPFGGAPTPSVDYTYQPRTANPLIVDFDAIASVATGTITAYDWNFQQSTYHSTSPSAHNYQYNTAGTYTVTLTVTTNQGATNTVSKTITVGGSTTTPPPSNTPPTVAITSTNLQSDGVTVKPVGSYTDSDGYVAQVVWAWGDSTSSTTLTGTASSPPATTTSHTYAASGTYTITVTATDDDGATASATATVTATLPTPSSGYTNDTGQGTNSGQQVTGSNYTLYSASGSDFGAQASAAGSGKQLSLPVGTLAKLKPLTTSVIHAADITAGGGVIGAGSDKSIVTQVANSSTGSSVQSGTTSSELVRVSVANAVFQDFQILGTTQSVKVMHGLDIRAANPTVRRVKLKGAGPGNDKAPPGETFGLSFNSSSGGLVEDVEIDGQGHGASNFGTNSWTGPLTINRMYTHSNPYSGGIALWQTKGGVTLNDCTFDGCRCFWNIERCSDTVTLNRPRIGTLNAATSGWANGAASAIGIFCESDATWGASASQAFRFVINDPRNLDGSVYSGAKITVNFGSANDGGTNYYGRTNFKAYNAAGTDISTSFFTYGGKPYN